MNFDILKSEALVRVQVGGQTVLTAARISSGEIGMVSRQLLLHLRPCKERALEGEVTRPVAEGAEEGAVPGASF